MSSGSAIKPFYNPKCPEISEANERIDLAYSMEEIIQKQCKRE